jgi:hypothetical protein
MRFRSPLLTAGAVLAIVAAVAAPALAHEEIDPKTVTVGEPAYLSLTVANEKEVNLVKVRLDGPPGVEFGTALEGKDGWATTRSAGRMVWDGTVQPEHFESFRFETEAPDQPGTLAYMVMLTYADGTSEQHEVDITAVPATTGTTSPSATTVTSAATPTTAAAAPAGSEGDSGTAKTALAVSIVALLVAAGALAVAARRSGGNRASDGSGPGAAQDW